MTRLQHIRDWLQKHQHELILRRANAEYRQSVYQTSAQQHQDQEFAMYGSGWFALAAIVIAFGAGYVVADDKRIERDQQDQLSALCAQPWPDAPDTAAARFHACSQRN